ncbi:hypothetical protein ABW21_db0207970 [Orbilia brochopaga]|nr:hypothetical protein ABW21_db0207970 [Drechslerella brochopaga]
MSGSNPRKGSAIMPVRITILDLPLELLRMIIEQVPWQSLHSIRQSCKELRHITAEYFYQRLVLTGNLELDASRFSLVTLQPSVYADHELPFLPVKSLQFVPHERRTLKDIIKWKVPFQKHRCELLPRGPRNYSRTRTNSLQLMQSLTEWGGFNFRDLEDLSFSSQEICTSNPGFVTTMISQYPHIKRLTLPFTLRLQKHQAFEESVLLLDSLRYFHVKVCWPHAIRRDVVLQKYNEMDPTVIWDIVRANASTLESLRVNFCEWGVDRNLLCDEHGAWRPCSDACVLRDPVTSLVRYLYDVNRYNGVPGTQIWNLDNIDRLFPNSNTRKLPRLHLKTLQFTHSTLIPNIFQIGASGAFFEPETLKVLSLIDCPHSNYLFHACERAFVSLRYLQLVGSMFLKDIGDTLLALPEPLTGLYVVAAFNDPTSFDWRCLDRHRDNLKYLWLQKFRPLVLVDSYPFGRGQVTGRVVKRRQGQRRKTLRKDIDFSAWPVLQELTIPNLPKGLKNLDIPASLRFLRVIDCQPRDITMPYFSGNNPSYANILKHYIARSKRLQYNLQAVGLGLPSTGADRDFPYKFEQPDPVIVAFNKGRRVNSDCDSRKENISAQEITVQQFEMRYPEISIMSNKRASWIDRFI